MDHERRHAVCPLDCPDTCSLDVTVRDGRAVKIDAGALHPVTGGFICSKVRDFARRLYGAERLLHPMKRTGAKGSGRFEEITWDEAIATIARRLERVRSESGGEAILPFSYGGSNGLLTDRLTDAAFFRRLGASRLDRTVCAAPTTAAATALYGDMPCADITDVAFADRIIIWGGNPRASNIHIIPFLKEAKGKGAKITLIDPRKTLSDSLVDRHIAVFPGTDVVLALSMIACLEERGSLDMKFLEANAAGFEELLAKARKYPPEKAAAVTGVNAGTIRETAEEYAAARRAIIRCGWGVERNRNGESAIAAILAIPAVTGRFGRRGDGYILSTSRGYRYDGEKAIGVPAAKTRRLNMCRLGAILGDPPVPADPPVRALFVYNCNPAATMPDQGKVIDGLLREDLFTMVSDQVMTDTARFADIVLPATTFLEHGELKRSYGWYGYTYAGAAIDRSGEAKSNGELFALLGRAFGFDDEIFSLSEEERVRRVTGAVGDPVRGKIDTAGADASSPAGNRLVFDFPGEHPVPFRTVFPGTPDGKIDLFPASLGERLYDYIALDDENFPLALISPSSPRTISSTFGEREKGIAAVTIHPEDAAARKIAQGDIVRVHNRRGSVVLLAKLSGDIRPGVVAIHKGLWRRSTMNGFTANVLAPGDVTTVTGAATFNDARVEVEPFDADRPGG